MDFSTTLFRCSGLSNIMGNPRSKEDKAAGKLSETTKSYLAQIFVKEKYGREKDITAKQMEKGLLVEEDSITLYSRVKKVFFKKNDLRITNPFLTGHPDLFIGPNIRAAEEIIDMKSSWDLYTFSKTRAEGITTANYWQAQGYMALTNAKRATVGYCLIDTPDVLIDDEKKKLFFRMNAGTMENRDYMEACEKLDFSMKYGDIPMEERVLEFKVERNEDDIAAIYYRVKACRDYLNEKFGNLKSITPVERKSEKVVPAFDPSSIKLTKIKS